MTGDPPGSPPVTEAGVLRARARALAARPPDDAQARGGLEIIVFSLAGERYAIETRFVGGVHRMRDMVLLPCAPACVLGVVNVRGHVVPVISLRQLLGLAEQRAGDTGTSDIVLLRLGDVEAGLPADPGATVRHTEREALQAGLPGFTDAVRGCVRGITADGITLLDVGGVLGHPLLQANDLPGQTIRELTR